MSPLFAEKFLSDPRVLQAKQLILDALLENQEHVTGIQAANPARQEIYAALLTEMAALRGAKLYYPYLGSGFGSGPLVELLDGSIKYDFISGIGVHYFGHCHPDLVAAGIDAAYSNTIMQGHLQQNLDAIKLSSQLVKASGLDHCFLTTSGAMANENALKLAFQKNYPASRLLAFDHCFTGRTWALSQISDKPAFRENLPVSLHVDYVPFYDPANPKSSIERALQTLNDHVDRYPKQHAAMIFELIQGEGGFYEGSTPFFQQLMKRCRELNIAVIADEVQTFGRTTQLFAYQHYGVSELVDIATVGKVLQVCATLFSDDYRPKMGLLSQTFTGSTASLKAAQVILHHLQHEGYLGPEGKIAHISAYFENRLKDLANRHPTLIHGPFGVGAMVAITPFDGQAPSVAHYLQRLFEAGVIAFTAGSHPTRVRFLVPVGVITTEDIDRVMIIIEETLLKMSQELYS